MVVDTEKSDISAIDLQNRSEQHEEDKNDKTTTITVADMIGEYGFYQFSMTLLAFIRYVCLAMMTNTGPLIAPDVEFSCQADIDILANIKKPANTTIDEFLKGKCTLDLVNGSSYECNSWTYNSTLYGVTLTDSFNLICDDDFYRSTFQSVVSIGVMMASVMWGSISDAHGRNFTIWVCFVISLFAGTVSYLANSFFIYTIARAICSFSDLGLVVSLTTIIVELLGNKFRGAVCIIVYTGWSIGVMIMPWLTEYFRNYQQLMLFTVVCHLCTLPWLISVGESIRWSMINDKIDNAKEELVRISKWNRRSDQQSLDDLEKKFAAYRKKFDTCSKNKKISDHNDKSSDSNSIMNICWSQIFGGLSKIRQLFGVREIAITTVTMIWITFTSELVYMLFTLVNSDIGDNVKLNYAIGGFVELAATIISIVIISEVSRRLSLSGNLLTIASLTLVLAFTHQSPVVSIIVLNIDKLAISTLSSLIFVTTTETFPTNLRQTGFGLCGTLGGLGAVLAPFVRTELTNLLGMTNVMLIVSIFPLSAALIIPFFLRETKGVELLDEVDDMD